MMAQKIEDEQEADEMVNRHKELPEWENMVQLSVTAALMEINRVELAKKRWQWNWIQ